MRTLAFGDIHGCLVALEVLLSVAEVKPEDNLVFLGDYVDRGRGSRGVLERLISLSQREKTWFLRGNHEIYLLNSLEDRQWAQSWLRVGGMETLDSYGVTCTTELPPEHLNFVREACLNFHETATHIFVHACALPHLALEDQPEEALFWTRFDKLQPHDSGKKVVCGHTVQKNGLPRDKGYGVCLDTGAYGGGWLTCLDVTSNQYWQSNEKGQVRHGHLNDDGPLPLLLL